jgi:hypothetical protein
MIAREVLAVNGSSGRDHIDLKCVDANYHHHPERIAPLSIAPFRKARREGFETHLHRLCRLRHRRRARQGLRETMASSASRAPTAFPSISATPPSRAEGDAMITTFFITDFLARHFETFLMRPLGSTAFLNCATPISAITNGRSIWPRQMMQSLTQRRAPLPNGWGCGLNGVSPATATLRRPSPRYEREMPMKNIRYALPLKCLLPQFLSNPCLYEVHRHPGYPQ